MKRCFGCTKRLWPWQTTITFRIHLNAGGGMLAREAHFDDPCYMDAYMLAKALQETSIGAEPAAR